MSAADALRVPYGECPHPNRTMDDVRRWAYYRLTAMMGPTDTRRVHGPIAQAPCTRCALPIPRAPWQPTKDAIHPSCLAAEAVARGTFDHPTTTR